MKEFGKLSRKPRIKVMGVGGCGINITESLIASDVPNIEFVAVSSDSETLLHSQVSQHIQLSSKTTKQKTAKASTGDSYITLSDRLLLRSALQDTDLLIIIAGLGGSTGSNISPLVTELAEEIGVPCLAFVTTPFAFEGFDRNKVAEGTIAKLRERSTPTIVTSNQQLLKTLDERVSILDLMLNSDLVITDTIRGLTDLIRQNGIEGDEFAVSRLLLAQPGRTVIGRGSAQDSTHIMRAFSQAIINSNVDDTEIRNAKGLLVNIATNSELSVTQKSDFVSLVRSLVLDDTQIIVNSVVNNENIDAVAVSFLAIGLNACLNHKRPKFGKAI